jgi:hypothetical protein
VYTDLDAVLHVSAHLRLHLSMVRTSRPYAHKDTIVVSLFHHSRDRSSVFEHTCGFVYRDALGQEASACRTNLSSSSVVRRLGAFICADPAPALSLSLNPKDLSSGTHVYRPNELVGFEFAARAA